MSRRVLKSRTDVCQLCEFMITRQSPLRQPNHLRRTFKSPLFAPRRNYAQASNTSNSPAPLTDRPVSRNIGAPPIPAPSHLSQAELEKLYADVQTTCSALLALDRPPSEQEVLHALGKCNSLVDLLTSDTPIVALETKDGPVSALLSIEESPTKNPPPNLHAWTRSKLDSVSKLSFSIVEYGPVFITPEVLGLYVKIQASLGRPETFPEVFYMYAHKPTPQKGTPLQYSNPNPHKVSNSVPITTADRALQTAITSRHLEAAMGIVESTYATTAFQRAKFVRKGLLPATGVAAAPIAAYAIASSFAEFQTTMDSGLATNVAFAGIMAYTLFTGTIGVVAVTTANDQMDRVTWAPGVPLRERWIREEERAAIDKIAGSWGFRESWRKGEEEGDDWDTLREWIGGKGMMLDRVELMDGME